MGQRGLCCADGAEVMRTWAGGEAGRGGMDNISFGSWALITLTCPSHGSLHSLSDIYWVSARDQVLGMQRSLIKS